VVNAVCDFDIVYLHNEPNILLFLRKRSEQKIILHMHNDHLSMRMFRPLYRHALAKADVVICVSDYIRKQAVRNFPEYSDRFKVVFNSTDPNIFRPYGQESFGELASVIQFEHDKRYLLYVGRLTAIKGVHILIAAFRQIYEAMPNVRLIITGSSFFAGAAKTAYEQELVRMAESVREAIVFTGFLQHEKLRYLYSAVDVVVLPSVWQDPCPLVALEAMASGTCLVSSSVGGVPELVENGINGVLVEPGDARTLAKKICAVLSMPEKMREMETAAREKIIAAYNWERLADELDQVFDQLLAT
jgi:spore coat protein SA